MNKTKAFYFICVLLTSVFFDAVAINVGKEAPKDTEQKSLIKPAENDPKATTIANEVMKAMGGEKAWGNARHFHWNFFGARTLIWDKWTGNVRIEVPKENATYLLNINTMEGKAMVKGEEITDSVTLEEAIKKAKSIWINDSYWLIMPFKLQDPGVTLTYEGEQATEAGEMSDVLGLTFENVGLTPQNKYLVYVDKNSRLVTQWAFYRNATDKKPGFVLPWGEYKPYGKLLLSGDRGERDLTDIKVFKKLPETVYSSFEKPSL